MLLPEKTLVPWPFFVNDTATTEIYTLSLHDALPICIPAGRGSARGWFADRWWKRGRRDRHATFLPVSVPGQKPYVILPCQMPVWRPFRSVTQEIGRAHVR